MGLSKSRQNHEGRTFLGRLLFPVGLFLPLLATIFVALRAGYPLPMGLWWAQQKVPWLWLTDVLPIICVFYGRFLMQPKGGSRSAPLFLAILLLLFLVPCSTVLYAWQEARESVVTLRNTRQAGQLQTMALRLYIQLNQKPQSSARQTLAEMSQLRKEIKSYSPSAVMATESAWNTFYQEALNSGKLSFTTTLRMKDAAGRLTQALETDAKLARDEASQLLLGGILGILLSIALTLQLFYQLRLMETQLLESNTQQSQTNLKLEATNTQLEEANRRLATVNIQLEHTASRDALTGLYNRRALDERFQIEWHRAVRYEEPFAIALLDLDYFKTYNDSFGHPAGDAVLETIGMILQHGVRITDFATRYGGEEFLILLPNTNEQEAIRMSERLRVAIQAAPWKNRAVTASIGVALRTDKMTKPADLVDAADIALYNAKKTRNCVSSSQDHPLNRAA